MHVRYLGAKDKDLFVLVENERWHGYVFTNGLKDLRDEIRRCYGCNQALNIDKKRMKTFFNLAKKITRFRTGTKTEKEQVFQLLIDNMFIAEPRMKLEDYVKTHADSKTSMMWTSKIYLEKLLEFIQQDPERVGMPTSNIYQEVRLHSTVTEHLMSIGHLSTYLESQLVERNGNNLTQVDMIGLTDDMIYCTELKITKGHGNVARNQWRQGANQLVKAAHFFTRNYDVPCKVIQVQYKPNRRECKIGSYEFSPTDKPRAIAEFPDTKIIDIDF